MGDLHQDQYTFDPSLIGGWTYEAEGEECPEIGLAIVSEVIVDESMKEVRAQDHSSSSAGTTNPSSHVPRS